MNLTEAQIERYSRQIILPEIGSEGQKKLLNSKVLVVGCGGLGSAIILYLGAAGIGKLGLVDSDEVELSNLQRQIIHTTSDIGKPKVISAKEKVNKLNPDVEVECYNLRLTSENILPIIENYDVIIAGPDNFRTRYLVNDACVLTSKPLSVGAILQFSGQLTTIIPKKTACYRCLYEEPPSPQLVPTPQQAGIFGPIAGIIGLVQSMEVIKLILNKGKLLLNKLFIYDTLEMDIRIVDIPKNPNCVICSDKPKIKQLIDYEKIMSGGY